MIRGMTQTLQRPEAQAYPRRTTMRTVVAAVAVVTALGGGAWLHVHTDVHHPLIVHGVVSR